MFRITLQQSRRTPYAFPFRSRRRLFTRLPYRHRTLDADRHKTASIPSVASGPELRIIAITGVGQHHTRGYTAFPRPLVFGPVQFEASFEMRSLPERPTFFRRGSESLAHTSGRYKRNEIGILDNSVVTERLTATRQLSCLPTCPQYCRVTPTECLPFFGKPVSSTTHATTGPCRSIEGSTVSSARSNNVSSSQGASATR